VGGRVIEFSSCLPTSGGRNIERNRGTDNKRRAADQALWSKAREKEKRKKAKSRKSRASVIGHGRSRIVCVFHFLIGPAAQSRF